MSGAARVLQAALAAAFAADPALGSLTGRYEAPPPNARYPYLVFAGTQAADWSTKTEAGRELRLAINLWDDGDGPDRIAALADAVCADVEALPPALPGWRIASVALGRVRTLRTAAGPWSALIEYRVRLLAD